MSFECYMLVKSINSDDETSKLRRNFNPRSSNRSRPKHQTRTKFKLFNTKNNRWRTHFEDSRPISRAIPRYQYYITVTVITHCGSDHPSATTEVTENAALEIRQQNSLGVNTVAFFPVPRNFSIVLHFQSCVFIFFCGRKNKTYKKQANFFD